MITLDMLLRVCPKGKASLMNGFVSCLNEEGPRYGLTDPLDIQHFIAQCAHESDGFQTFEEYASGKAYEGRKDLGNTHKGDGVKFKGRGAIQLTGRANYTAFAAAAGVDYITHPEWVAGPINGARAALWYWKKNGLSALAEKDDLMAVTKKVNGGTNGLENRKLYLERAKKYIVIQNELHEPLSEAASAAAPEPPSKPIDTPEPLEPYDLPTTPEQTWIWKALKWWRGD